MPEYLRENRRISFPKIILFCLVYGGLVIGIIASLIPWKHDFAKEYPAVILDWSTQELLGTTQLAFSGTYTQYYSNLIFKDRFVGEFYLTGNEFSQQYGAHAFIDFQRGLSIREGICAYMDTEKNQTAPFGNIVQKAPLQTGYLLIDKEKSGWENDIIVVFPADNLDEACEIFNRMGKKLSY